MKAVLLSLWLSVISIVSFAQDDDTDKITDPIVAEGKKMYRSEMASWYGTDIFLARYPDLKTRSAGYFSYTDKELNKCIFFSNDEDPDVTITISFDSTFNINTALTDTVRRSFTEIERSLYEIRKTAYEDINSGKDTIYKFYKNTSYNLIPLVDGDSKKLYVLTGPKVSGLVVLGNDYLLSFDKDNKIVSKKTLHKNAIFINYGGKDQKEPAEITAHTHLPETGDFITATDVCTLMLYSKFAKWKSHWVVSKNYYSIWDCNESHLIVMTKEAMDRINKDVERRKKD